MYPDNGYKRITPAGAGRSQLVLAVLVVEQDHPRGCGEKRSAARNLLACVGSPPRVRGEEGKPMNGLPLFRITPAGAGRSCSKKSVKQSRQDHPRGCGEKVLPCTLTAKQLGSPPRVRGEAVRQGWIMRYGRITPAGAGRSDRVNCICSIQLGSPPRVRGEACTDRANDQRHRITPAGAGRRSQTQSSPDRSEDHPRGCGEKRPLVVSFLVALGSPPRVRGEGISVQ